MEQDWCKTDAPSSWGQHPIDTDTLCTSWIIATNTNLHRTWSSAQILVQFAASGQTSHTSWYHCLSRSGVQSASPPQNDPFEFPALHLPQIIAHAVRTGHYKRYSGVASFVPGGYILQMAWVTFSLCKLISSSSSVGKGGEKRRLSKVAGAWTFTVRGLEVVKTNLATYRGIRDPWMVQVE